MNDKYTLDAAGNPVPEPDLMAWARWMNDGNRRVAFDMVGEVDVSTVFLGIDHNWSGGGAPVLWETMTFGPEPWSSRQWRYSSRDDALLGHGVAVELLRAGAEPPEVLP